MMTYQPFLYNFPSQTFSAGSPATQTLRDIPKQQFGRLVHLAAFAFEINYTPTYTVAPTQVGANNFLTQCDFWDGALNRFQGGLNVVRAHERLNSGGVRVPDGDLNGASAAARVFRRTLHVGPPQFSGSPSDFAIPTGMLENGELRMKFGTTSDFKGTVSAVVGSMRIQARCILMDEIRIPPAYQVLTQTLNAPDATFAGRALYTMVALMNSGNFDAIASGGFGNIRLDLGQGDIVPTIKAADLTHNFADDFGRGEFLTVQGDPESSAAIDNNSKIVNRSTPTAIVGADQDLQPVLWSPPDSRITKCYAADSVARIRWDGSNTSALAVLGRITSQANTVVAALGSKALGRLGLEASVAEVKTISKDNYKGPYTEYMPWKMAINRK